MPEQWPIAAKVLQIKGDLSYRDFEKAILAKTGKKLSFTFLQQLATGERYAGRETIFILTEYANKPISWFYESTKAMEGQSPDQVILQTPDGHLVSIPGKLNWKPAPDASSEEWSEYLVALIAKVGAMESTDRQAILKMAEALVAAREEAKKDRGSMNVKNPTKTADCIKQKEDKEIAGRKKQEVRQS